MQLRGEIAGMQKVILKHQQTEMPLKCLTNIALKQWSAMVCSTVDKAETNWLHMAKKAMRERLVEECIR